MNSEKLLKSKQGPNRRFLRRETEKELAAIKEFAPVLKSRVQKNPVTRSKMGPITSKFLVSRSNSSRKDSERQIEGIKIEGEKCKPKIAEGRSEIKKDETF